MGHFAVKNQLQVITISTSSSHKMNDKADQALFITIVSWSGLSDTRGSSLLEPPGSREVLFQVFEWLCGT